MKKSWTILHIIIYNGRDYWWGKMSDFESIHKNIFVDHSGVPTARKQTRVTRQTTTFTSKTRTTTAAGWRWTIAKGQGQGWRWQRQRVGEKINESSGTLENSGGTRITSGQWRSEGSHRHHQKFSEEQIIVSYELTVTTLVKGSHQCS